MTNPCRDCKDRHAGCHSKSCPHGWYEWDVEHKKKRDMLWKEEKLIYSPSDWKSMKKRGGD